MAFFMREAIGQNLDFKAIDQSSFKLKILNYIDKKITVFYLQVTKVVVKSRD